MLNNKILVVNIVYLVEQLVNRLRCSFTKKDNSAGQFI